MAKTLKPIPLPKEVSAKNENGKLTFKGKLDQLTIDIPPHVDVDISPTEITVTGRGAGVSNFVGLTRALIRNQIAGVSAGFTETLEIRGMGFRAQKTKEGATQILVGFSHPVNYVPPKGITIDLNTIPNPDDPKTQITEVIIKGANKQLVGEIAANLRRLRKPDPYHGKGIRYKGEYVRKKAGKRAVATQQ
jgi:large subunit ribosomal protein L6